MTTATTPETRIRLQTTELVFNLPERVAIEEGLFAREGLDVTVGGDRFLDESTDWVAEPSKDPLPQFEGDTFDTYNMCEWGVIDRVEKGEVRPARIGYLRPAVVAQVILSFRPDVQEPHDLADRPVGIVHRTGQHYTALQILEGTLRRDQIRTEHRGNPLRLLADARSGELAAATVMEPFVSLGLREGAHIVGAHFYRGGQVFYDDVPFEARKRYVQAVNAAVDLINADRDRYRGHIVEAAEGQLGAEELSHDWFRYTYAKSYTKQRYDESYAWMQSWGLATGEKPYEQAIAPVL